MGEASGTANQKVRAKDFPSLDQHHGAEVMMRWEDVKGHESLN